ncbi:LysR family transcriptional regulator [Yersinia pseudotuberculosis]|uniref:Transcriptional regulator, LysR family n=1 Tax=Yersinia pseudotuberculosis serotype O:3 (strain YPIII) TaxID=502800 RepID=A0A0H3B1H4_YERPY|nr:LysR family transcriptional regulator [Yersinia pseudotuberculosis]AJJ57373.1 bacterial regulatory helix-turn-helix, lysR family protein [Yersinia pseudotuberculosis YPIII]AYW87459.1 LysR family transcriptional regulator [Yersinia pseudotuberculosis]AYX02011.1 LysR family transcriptional regulator [Yersinia pseudotuberculosis]AZA29767.1 LysR family transcriptional regulator [Yersinia pseudotuberculosis]MBK1425469.1 LysR family transcriptional regulator [Yersinia pseudotuberculosis]
MHYSPEALIAFVEAAALGSFSAAARKLRKSQSTISTAIANLEADLGLTLFDRQARQPVLTDHGRRVLAHVQEILAAGERLTDLSIRLAGQVETRLTFVLSDTYYQPAHHENLLRRFEQRYPDVEFECLVAEDEDVIDLLQLKRAHIGVVEMQERYPPDIAATRLAAQTEMAVFVLRGHPLTRLPHLKNEQLATTRQLCLNTYNRTDHNQSQGLTWSAPSYLMLLEMAEQGFGWAILPRWLVEQFGREKLVTLPVQGWPKMISIDAVWSKKSPPGPAGYWLLDQLTEGTNSPH